MLACRASIPLKAESTELSQPNHIKPYGSGGPHEPENGLLLRSDLHTLFDQGYVTVDASQFRVVVSNRIREEFEYGRDYYQMHGRAIRLPAKAIARPRMNIYPSTMVCSANGSRIWD
jgi:predicted restriction endonuclease